MSVMVSYFAFSYIQVAAEVQRPEICVLSSHIVLDEMYLNVPVEKDIVLENKSLLPSHVTWKPVSSL